MDGKQRIIVVANGAVVGGSMLVPGVSGGTMCIILGIYDQLIHAVSTFFQNKRANFWLLFWFCLGGGTGIFLLSRPLLQLMECFPKPAAFFFMGAVAGSVPMTFQKAKVESFHWRVPVYVAVGMVIVWALAKLPTMDQLEGGVPEQIVMLVVSGVVAAVALVLPGISVSYLLLVLGMYNSTIKAIGNLDFQYLIPLGLGLMLGIVATTRLLEHLMQVYPRATYLIILGFLEATIPTNYPGIPVRSDTPGSALAFLSGVGVDYNVSNI